MPEAETIDQTEVDDLGVPIKKKTAVTVDDLGVPVKKKTESETSTLTSQTTSPVGASAAPSSESGNYPEFPPIGKVSAQNTAVADNTAVVIPELKKPQNPDFFTRLPSEAASHHPYTPVERSIILGTIDKFNKNPIFTNPQTADKAKQDYYLGLDKAGIDVRKVIDGVNLENNYQNSALIQSLEAPVQAIKEGAKSVAEGIKSATPEGIVETVSDAAINKETPLETTADVILKPAQKIISGAFRLAGATPEGAAFYSIAKAIEKKAPELSEQLNKELMPFSSATDENTPEYKKFLATMGDAVVGAIASGGVHGAIHPEGKVPMKVEPKDITPDLISRAVEWAHNKTPEQLHRISDAMNTPELMPKVLQMIDIENDIAHTNPDHPAAATLAKKHQEIVQSINDDVTAIAEHHASVQAGQSMMDVLKQEKEKLVQQQQQSSETGAAALQDDIDAIGKQQEVLQQGGIEETTIPTTNEQPTTQDGQGNEAPKAGEEKITPTIPEENIIEPINQNDNAISQQSATEILPGTPEGTGIKGSKRVGVGSEQQGNGLAGQGGIEKENPPQSEDSGTGKGKPDEKGNVPKLDEGDKVTNPEPVSEEPPDKTPLELAREKRKAAKKKLDKLNDNLGIISDPEDRARKLVEYHKALVDEIKEWVKEKAGTLADYIRDSGEEFTLGLKRAWDEANGARPVEDSKELGYDHPDEPVFGIKNADTKAQNAALGFPDIDLTADQRRDLKTVMEGAAKLEGNAETIIEATHQDKRPMNAEDEVVVLNHVIKLSNELIAEEKRFEEAINNNDDAAAQSALLNGSALTERIKRANDALQISGYEQGLAFRVRQIMKKRDYSLVESIRKYQMANNGEAVPHAIRQKFADLAKKIEDLTSQNEALEQKHEDAVSQWAFEKIKLENERDKATQTKSPRPKGKDLIAEGLDDLATIFGSKKNIIEDGKPEIRKAVSKIARGILEVGLEKGKDLFDEVKKYIKDKFDQDLPDSYKEDVEKASEKATPSASVNKDGKLEIPRELIKSVVERGVDDAEDLTSKVHDILKEQMPDKEFSHRQVRDAITDYGKTIHLSQEEIDVKIRQLKQEGRDVSGLEDAIKGEGVKRTGLQRDPVTDKHREMLKKIKEEMKKHPQDEADIAKKWKSSLDAIKTNLNNQITDLTKRLDDLQNNRPVDEKNVAKKIEYDEEAKSLQEHRDNLKQAVEAIEGKPKMSDEQKVNNAITAAEKSMAEYDRRIKNKDFAPRVIPKLPEVEGLTTKLNDVRKQRDLAKAEYEKLSQTDESAQNYKKLQDVRKALDNYEKQIEQLAKDINNRNLDYKKKTTPAYENAATKSAKARLDEGKRILKQMRDEAGIAEQRRIDLWKKNQQKAIDALEEEKKNGFPEKAPKPAPKPLTQDQSVILGQRQKLMNERDLAIKQRELDNRSGIEKKIAKAVAFSRNIKLSSIITVGKLLAFDIHNIAWYKPLKELLPNVIKGGERHSGSFNSKAISAAYKVFIDKATYEDMSQARKTGKSQFQLAYGLEKPLPPELSSYFGHLHAALKVPSIRAEFLFSVEKRMQAEIENNGAWAATDLETIAKVNAAALNDASAGILLGENITNDAYSRVLNYLKDTQKNNKGAAALKKSAAYLAEFQFPIVKVPTNYVKEVGAHTPLGAMKAVWDISMSKGIDNMTPKEIDNVNNLFKSAAIGTAFLALGYYQRNNIGGYDDRLRGKQGRGSIKLFGHEVPHWFLHFPPFELLQIGATIGHYADKKDETGKGGVAEGIKQATGGAIQQTPFIGEPMQYMRAAGREGGWANLIASDAAGALIPPDLAKVAYATDTQDTSGTEQSGFHPMSETVYRPLKTPTDQFKGKIPGLRKGINTSIDNTIDKQESKDKTEAEYSKMFNPDDPDYNTPEAIKYRQEHNTIDSTKSAKSDLLKSQIEARRAQRDSLKTLVH